jgi:NAD(P)-dependent dehydrogenase (short-subunit alcohol dehydrogenase family)
VAVVTGGSSGIGAATARALVAQGWHVIAVGRTRERLNSTLAFIRSEFPQGRIDGLLADFESIQQVERVAQDIAALTRRVDVLINNAGGLCKERRETSAGFELLFAVNHLAPFLLTRRLLPLMRAVPSARIINVSSAAHKYVRDMRWNDLQLRRRFSVAAAYAQSKLASLLFTRELARRLSKDSITVNAVHPGLVTSNFMRQGGRLIRVLYAVAKPFCLSSEQGADTIVWLATSPELEGRTGGYYYKRRAAAKSRAACSDTGARRLWNVSERLISDAKAAMLKSSARAR